MEVVARRLDAAADEVAGAAARLSGLGLDSALGAAAGRFGEVGRALSGQWSAALAARAREAAAIGACLVETGSTLRVVAAGYAEADIAARRRLRWGEADGSA